MISVPLIMFADGLNYYLSTVLSENKTTSGNLWH
jgi:hypothetical protein